VLPMLFLMVLISVNHHIRYSCTIATHYIHGTTLCQALIKNCYGAFMLLGSDLPRCRQVTTEEHDRRQQHKQDRRLRDKVVFLTLIKRRFRRLWCGKH